MFGFTTSAGALYQAHWIGLAVTGAGLLLTTAMLSWSAQNRRGYGPALLAATAAPLLLANPAVALLEDFGFMHRQLFALKEQVMMLTVMGEASLFAVSSSRACAGSVMRVAHGVTVELCDACRRSCGTRAGIGSYPPDIGAVSYPSWRCTSIAPLLVV